MTEPENKKLFSIGKLSKLSGVSISALRYYDKEGLLVPAYKNEENGYRYYVEEQFGTLSIIRNLQSVGLSLDEIREFLNRHDQRWLERVLFNKIKTIKSEMGLLQSQCRSVESVYKRIRVNNDSDIIKYPEMNEDPYPIEMLDIKEMWVLSTRHSTELDVSKPFYDRVLEIENIRNSYGLYSNGPYIAIFHDGYEKQFNGEVGDLELCVPIIKPDEFICPELKTIGGFLSIGATHNGPYETIIDTYNYLTNWFEENGYMINGPAYEFYYKDICLTDKKDSFITKVFFPRKLITK